MSKNIWITTDTHLGHEQLPRLDERRPKNFEELIYKGLEQVVTPDSVLLHLGDVALCNRANEEPRHKALFEASGAAVHILVLGNHDKRSMEWYYNVGWDFVVDGFYLYRWGKGILFSHAPKNYLEWGTKFSCNIHGHTHGNGHRSEDVVNYREGWNIEIALENLNYRPILLTQKLVNGHNTFTKV